MAGAMLFACAGVWVPGHHAPAVGTVTGTSPGDVEPASRCHASTLGAYGRQGSGRKTVQGGRRRGKTVWGYASAAPRGAGLNPEGVGDRHGVMGPRQLAARGRKRRRGSGPAPGHCACGARSGAGAGNAPPGGCIERLVCPHRAGTGQGAEQEPAAARKTKERRALTLGEACRVRSLGCWVSSCPPAPVPAARSAGGVLSPWVSLRLCPGHGSSAAALLPPASRHWHGPASLGK